ncbi:MAG: hypothetical protein ACJA16_005218 [Akkermansiaceae bacterium]|jgi:hypothetical protein
MAGAFVHGLAGDFLSLETNPTVVGADEACDHVEGCRFAGTVWSEEAHDFTGTDAQADFIDDAAATVGFLETFDLQERRLI